MTFVYPLLLSGLVLAGIPVLLHLIMRQKPKRLLFPAVRFLLQRHRTNQRKLQLRHLILLALRMLLIVLVCLALARPKIFSERFNLTSDRPVAAVLIFDTSYSMEYSAGGHSRLDEAKRRSQELLDELPPESRVAVLSTAELGGEWLPALSQARERIASLELRPSNNSVTAQLLPAYELLVKLDQELDNPDEMPTRFIYVFSDRAQSCWNAHQLENLQRARDRISAPGVFSVFVDVGVDEPADVAIVALDLTKQAIAANQKMALRATVRCSGRESETEILCRLDGEATVDRRPVNLRAGESKTIVFERRGLALGFHQAQLSVAPTDNMPFNNNAYATFEVRPPRQVLVICDNVKDASIWTLALQSAGAFDCKIKTTFDPFIRNLGPTDLSAFQAVCILNVAQPGQNLWQALNQYVRDGGGLAVVPGGEEMARSDYNNEEAQKLLPGHLVKVVDAGAEGARWIRLAFQHPLMAPFKEWYNNTSVDFRKPGVEPAARRYWQVEPRDPDASMVADYETGAGNKPALIERLFDRKAMRGRVLLFTTALDDRHVAQRDRWNTYLETSFYLVLVNETIGYLAGDFEDASLNFASGQGVHVPLPALARHPTYTVQGPGLTPAEAVVARPKDQSELQIQKAVMPGNYTVVAPDNTRLTSFSMNIPPDESDLTKIPQEQIEALFGPNAVLPLDRKTTLQEALQGHWAQPVELLPWLMMLVLVALAAENFLANKFYRRETQSDELEKEAASSH